MKRHSSTMIQRQQKKTAKLKTKRAAKQKRCRKSQLRGHSIAGQLYQTLAHFFPDLFEHLRVLEDCRTRSDYELAELIMAGIALFVFKQGSRNAFNNQRQEHRFRVTTANCSNCACLTWTRWMRCCADYPSKRSSSSSNA